MASRKKAGGNAKTAEAKQKRELFEITPEGAAEAIGSNSTAFQNAALTQALETLWRPDWKSEEIKERELQAVYDALRNIAPRSELEGMLAVQMIGTHNAAMECLRRAMTEGQTFEGRDQNLKHAAKLMGLYERQLAALDKHRGKGQQKITVEHVTVEAGGQAIVGNVAAPASAQSSSAPIPPALTHASENGVPLPDPATTPERVKKRAGKNSK